MTPLPSLPTAPTGCVSSPSGVCGWATACPSQSLGIPGPSSAGPRRRPPHLSSRVSCGTRQPRTERGQGDTAGNHCSPSPLRAHLPAPLENRNSLVDLLVLRLWWLDSPPPNQAFPHSEPPVSGQPRRPHPRNRRKHRDTEQQWRGHLSPRPGPGARPAALTWMRLSTLSCTMVGGLFLGRMVLTSTPSTKSWLATSRWKRCPQFLTQVSKTWRPGGARERSSADGGASRTPTLALCRPPRGQAEYGRGSLK